MAKQSVFRLQETASPVLSSKISVISRPFALPVLQPQESDSSSFAREQFNLTEPGKSDVRGVDYLSRISLESIGSQSSDRLTPPSQLPRLVQDSRKVQQPVPTSPAMMQMWQSSRQSVPTHTTASTAPVQIKSITKQSNTAEGNQIQRYTDVSSKNGQNYRMADDISVVIQQDSKYGSQRLWAEPGKAKAASTQLEAAQSVIRLEDVGSPLSVTRKGTVVKTLQQVKPGNVSNKTAGTGASGMQLWADCGKSARDVIGAGQGTGQGAPKAIYTDPTRGQLATTAGTSSPDQMKQEILLQYIFYYEKTNSKEILDKAKLNGLRSSLNKAASDYDIAAKAGKPKATLDNLATKYFFWATQISNLIVNCYHTKISDADREKLDKQAGINRWADPEVGQGFTASTGGAPKSGHGGDTWNFHWAGVVMRSNDGNDHIALENYAVGDASVQNTDWVYQMYGSAKVAETDPSKKGQTFHEQHRDVHGQHGENPTTMTVKPR